MSTVLPTLIALAVAVTGVFIGNLIGKVLPPLSRFSLPGAVLGGLLALGLGPQVVAPDAWRLIPAEEVEGFYRRLAAFPVVFVNVVFACLMLGRRFDSVASMWRGARRMVVMGHIFAWGQYAVGLLLVVAVLDPLLGVNPLAGVLIAVGFQGGHGTAAGLGENFERLDFAQGEPFAMAIATAGVLVGVVGGPFLASLLARGSLDVEDREASEDPPADIDDLPAALRPDPLTGRATVHLAAVSFVVGVGWLSLQGLQELEDLLRPGAETHISNFMPLFSIVLVTGMVLQLLLQRVGWDALFDRAMFERIGSFGLDMVVFGALATLALDVIGPNWLVLLALCAAGIGWNLVVLLLIGPHVYRHPWFAYGMGDFGGGTATTASGVMLVRVVDPRGRTGALNTYADKQPFYEPIMGGGLVTAMALPTVAAVGPLVSLAITASILLIWLGLARRLARK